MTVAEKLVEVGLRCAVCGIRVSIGGPLGDEWIPSKRPVWVVSCPECLYEVGFFDTTEEALCEYLILTGGPVPGVIATPKGINKYPICEYKGGYSTGFPPSGDVKYWLWPDQRNHETIRPWLEQEIPE